MEERRPYLKPTNDPREHELADEAEGDEVRHLLSLCVGSTALWFRVEFTIDGERQAILPEDFINARSKNEDGYFKFIDENKREIIF